MVRAQPGEVNMDYDLLMGGVGQADEPPSAVSPSPPPAPSTGPQTGLFAVGAAKVATKAAVVGLILGGTVLVAWLIAGGASKK